MGFETSAKLLLLILLQRSLPSCNGLSLSHRCKTMPEIFAPYIRSLSSCSRLSHRQMQKNVDGNTFRNFLFNNILKWSDSGSYFTNKSPPKPKNPCTNLIHWTELMNALVKPHHRRQKAQSRKKDQQCCKFGCFRLIFSSSRRLRSLWRQICKITKAKNGKEIGLGTGKTYFVP